MEIFVRLPEASSVLRVMYPTISGINTYKITEIVRVCQGTIISVTPSSKAVIGAKAKTIIISFNDT